MRERSRHGEPQRHPDREEPAQGVRRREPGAEPLHVLRQGRQPRRGTSRSAPCSWRPPRTRDSTPRCSSSTSRAGPWRSPPRTRGRHRRPPRRTWPRPPTASTRSGPTCTPRSPTWPSPRDSRRWPVRSARSPRWRPGTRRATASSWRTCATGRCSRSREPALVDLPQVRLRAHRPQGPQGVPRLPAPAGVLRGVRRELLSSAAAPGPQRPGAARVTRAASPGGGPKARHVSQEKPTRVRPARRP